MRKAEDAVTASLRLDYASMGPHFFKCGKGHHECYMKTRLNSLQWGRTFSSAESWLNYGGKAEESEASMGPHFFKCGKGRGHKGKKKSQESSFNGAALFQVRKGPTTRMSAMCFIVLQWGRTFSSAERKSISIVCLVFFAASMGPHFFKCGKKSMGDCIRA